MKKPYFFIAAAFAVVASLLSTQVRAQTAAETATAASPWRFGIGLETGLVTGDESYAASFELGGTVSMQFNANSHLVWALTTGYYDFVGEEIPGTPEEGPTPAQSLGIIPVKIGLKASFASKFYLGIESGIGIETTNGNGALLIASPSMGYANKSWDFGLRYENFSGFQRNFGIVGLHVAYSFGL
jgi:hypothetical protein